MGTQTPHIAIIGGGYTGLTAAYELLKKGYRVTILERQASVGGLAADFTIEGTALEKAYHHLFRTDTDIISLVEELGISDKLEWHESSVAIYYDKQLYPFSGPIDLIKFSPLPLPDRIRTGLLYLFLTNYHNGESFGKTSALHWMKRWAGIAGTKVIWEPLLRGKFHNYAEDISMAWLWARIHTRGQSKAPGELKEKLGYFSGGFTVLTQALKEAVLSHNGEIRNSVNVSAIRKAGSRVAVVINDVSEIFDRVIVTAPSHVFVALTTEHEQMTDSYKEQLLSVPYLGAALHIFSTPQSLSEFYWHNINDLSAPFLVFIQHSNLVGKEKYNNQHVYYLGTYIPHDHKYFTMEDGEIKKLWYSYLKQMFPDFDETHIRESYFFKFKNAQHVVTKGYKERIPAMQTPLDNIYLSNFTQIYPEDRGTNFAVREGKKVAALVDQSFLPKDNPDTNTDQS
ncbi:MAG: NAD(P)/FAD-dependent oxidoreductase [Candidatus Dojkabacteria bacterium]|nr:MAG: NAD(P)/FAD-dependent oxidoreductase [Candidatus Dojkabacteria bacterium]